MSLDVTLTKEDTVCRECQGTGKARSEIYFSNITHNLVPMAKAAGLYEACWRPEDLGYTQAQDLIAPLATGLGRLLDRPEEFRKYESENGWGTYDALCSWISGYLKACIENPTAKIHVSR